SGNGGFRRCWWLSLAVRSHRRGRQKWERPVLKSERESSISTSISPDSEPLTVTIARAKDLSGLGLTTLWALIRDRRLETVRVGRRTLVIYRSLRTLLS